MKNDFNEENLNYLSEAVSNMISDESEKESNFMITNIMRIISE